jgi:iron complex outermembrane receptor protein
LPIAWRLKSGGLRTNRADSEEQRFVAGIQGALWGWDYTAAYLKSESEATDNYIDGWVRESAMRAAISSGNVDVFSGNALDATGQVRSAQVIDGDAG